MKICLLLGILLIYNGTPGKAGMQQLVPNNLSHVSAETKSSSQPTVVPQNLKSQATNTKNIETDKERKVDYNKNKHEEIAKLNGNDNLYIPPQIQNNSHEIPPQQNSKYEKYNDKVNENYKERTGEYKIDKPMDLNKLLGSSNSYIPPKIQGDLHKIVPQLESKSQQANDKVNENSKHHKTDEKHSKTDDHENEHENKITKYHVEHYQHSIPHAIDDPLPEKVNYVPHIALDFPQAEQELKPVFAPAFVPGHLIPRDDIEPPVDKFTVKATSRYEQKTSNNAKTTTKQPNLHATAGVQAMTTTTTKASATSTKNPMTENVNDPDIKYPGNIKLFNPKEDIVFINHHHGPETNFDLFNSHENYNLNLRLPEVIFKAGDDISFANDLTVFDDYNHTFPPAAKDAKKSVDETTHTPDSDSESSASSPVQEYGETPASTKYSGEKSNSAHGYVYEKPDTPFDT